MKFLIPILFCIINYSLCQKLDGKVVKAFPKKVLPGFKLYHMAGNYVKPKQTQPKGPNKNEEYTTFPKPFRQGDKSHLSQMFPGSPYFTVDLPQEEQRTRVKKMLINQPQDFRRYKRDVKETTVTPKTDKTAIENKQDTPTKTSNTDTTALTTVKSSSKPVQGRRSNNTRIAKKSSRSTKLSRSKLSRVKHLKKSKRNAKQKRNGTKSGAVRSKNRKSKKSNHHGKKKGSPVRTLKGKRKTTNGTKSVKASLKKVKARQGSARRLIAAKDALIEQYPYTVSIQKDKQHWCAGALLNQRLVITTANCLWRSNSISRMHVRAGARHTDRGGQVAKIQEVMKHPGWKLRRNPDNDVAMVLLDQNIKFSHSVHGVDLPNRVMMPAFDDAWVTSWGSDRRDGLYDTQGKSLQSYYARFMERDKCNNVTQRFGVTVTENFICLSQDARRAPCTRDTGAPAVSDGVLWGLASWGIRKLCGTGRYPAMFSYLASQSNMDFITNATRFLMSEERYNPFPDRFPRPRMAETYPTPTPEEL